MLSLLDSLKMLHDKCNAVTFREGMPDWSAFDSICAVLTNAHTLHAEVLPLVYNALDSEVPQVLEKALKVIVQMAEGLDVSQPRSDLQHGPT